MSGINCNTVINKLITNPEIFGKFLNTLSMMEYIGARKILKSQCQNSIDLVILNHANEEIRHAQVLKKAAQKFLKIDPLDYSLDNLFCSESAGHYFQTVDRAVGEILSNVYLKYVLTTYLIEIRAIDFYQQLERILTSVYQHSIFRGILVEEDRHLNEVTTIVERNIDSTHIQFLKDLEKKAFSQWIKVLENMLKNHTDPRKSRSMKVAEK